MKRSLLIGICVALTLDASAVFAQDPDMADNPNNSSYPESNQLNSLPNPPDHTFGSDKSTYNLPADVPASQNKNTTIAYPPAVINPPTR